MASMSFLNASGDDRSGLNTFPALLLLFLLRYVATSVAFLALHKKTAGCESAEFRQGSGPGTHMRRTAGSWPQILDPRWIHVYPRLGSLF